MFYKITRSVFTVLLPAGLALLLCSQAAHAQQRGTLMQQQYGWNSGLGRTYGTGQLGSQFHLSTSYYFQYGLQPQLYGQSYNLGQQYGSQALLSAMQQQQYTQNALQQYVFEAQLIGAGGTAGDQPHGRVEDYVNAVVGRARSSAAAEHVHDGRNRAGAGAADRRRPAGAQLPRPDAHRSRLRRLILTR